MPPNLSLNADVPHARAAPGQRVAGYLDTLGDLAEGDMRSWLGMLIPVAALFSSCAAAEIVYTYSTTSSDPSAGPVNGQFVVPDAAIIDGFISASEITSYQFVLDAAMPPFVPATFASPDALTILSPFLGKIQVDPSSGAFLADAEIIIVDGATGQHLALTLTVGEYIVSTTAGPVVASGIGQWRRERVSMTPVPTLGHLGVAALNLILVLVALKVSHT